jgi:hypothetical protein
MLLWPAPRPFVRLQPSQVGMIIDRGSDFPPAMERTLAQFGEEMWLYRDQPVGTTRALNTYRGDRRRLDHPPKKKIFR